MDQASADKQTKRKRGTSISSDDDSQNGLDEINSSFKRLRTSENKSVEDENQDIGVTATIGDATESSSQDGLPKSGPEWVKLFVHDIRSASTDDDANSNAYKLLKDLEKFIRAEAQQEIMMLKQQSEKQVGTLKRAVTILHERLTNNDELLTKTQEKLRKSEVKSYALALHLQEATQNKISERVYPCDLC
ncbi:hypothetical protein MKX03_021196 [Papaver bracteatum]|nr:hypothetical protein MKX03_021196 [Papaver bracteatum]